MYFDLPEIWGEAHIIERYHTLKHGSAQRGVKVVLIRPQLKAGGQIDCAGGVGAYSLDTFPQETG